MAEYSVLSSEPRYKVDEFVEELIGRARLVITEMKPALEQLLQSMVQQFELLHGDDLAFDFKALRFQQIRWVKEGRLVIGFETVHRVVEDEPEKLHHEAVDTFVDDVVGRYVPVELADELKQFLRGMVMQLALLKKHQLGLDLTELRFGPARWHGDLQTGSMIIDFLYNRQPFGPQLVHL